MLDLPLVRWLKLAGGARFEASAIDMQAFDLFDPSVEVPNGSASLRGYDVLPSASLIVSPRDDMNVRLVGAQTLARPEFRELAPFQFTDFVGGVALEGDPTLETSKIWNADLRWEWFPSASEVIAVSLFYKYFDRPIERYRKAIYLVSFRNVERAQNVGVELELRKNLEFIGEAFDGFSLGANFAYVYSRVNLGRACNELIDEGCETTDVSTSRVRPLQGQSPYVVNAYLDYVNEDSGTSARLLYNAFGRRIEDVGGLNLPDTYEESIHDFDLVLNQELHEGLGLSFEIDNILNYPRTFTQGARQNVTYLAWPGTTIMLGLTYKI
jgi:outer membrane receptor protein involved in Fe transport